MHATGLYVCIFALFGDSNLIVPSFGCKFLLWAIGYSGYDF